jgi:hypothetical protein
MHFHVWHAGFLEDRTQGLVAVLFVELQRLQLCVEQDSRDRPFPRFGFQRQKQRVADAQLPGMLQYRHPADLAPLPGLFLGGLFQHHEPAGSNRVAALQGEHMERASIFIVPFNALRDMLLFDEDDLSERPSAPCTADPTAMA